ncbi:hypothetical protein [Rudanella paleaurantiibacter]|uniref:hypothetical protein n=1 Tax=Rudanella paleaurantiibacter TaxID=2614655 RepID=UPI00162432A9|nr:hypothetical protein [Rudanella paleaurantiibacter]
MTEDICPSATPGPFAGRHVAENRLAGVDCVLKKCCKKYKKGKRCKKCPDR